jgi:glycosyltransferase involved in cell wall biosynthesis
MKQKRILHIELSSNKGGIESFLLNLSHYINKEKFKFDFITPYPLQKFENQFIEDGGNVLKVHDFSNPFKYIRDINKVIKNGRYDVVHIHKNSLINLFPILIAKKNGVKKVVVHSHNTRPAGGKLLFIHYFNRLMLKNKLDYMVACSKEAGVWMFGEKNMRNRKVQIVPNGINTEEFKFNKQVRNEIRLKYKIGKDVILYGCVARFRKQKNHVFLIDVFRSLLNKNNNLKLMLIGNGELIGEIKDKVKSMGIEKNVIFIENVSNVSKLIQAFDAFLMPSLYEGFPIAGVEAQAAGLPIFVSNTVTQDLALTKSIKYLPLEKDAWVRELLKFQPYRNLNAVGQIREKNFDFVNTANIVEQIYLK